MKYSIICKDDRKSKALKQQLIAKLTFKYDEVNPNFVFSLGGDGTFLDAVRKYINNLDKTIFIAINTGNVGFYTEYLPSDTEEIISLLNGNLPIEKYSLLEFTINDESVNYALNEITIDFPHHLFEATIKVDDEELMDVRADGICVSTPSGSTAYNKSLKGAVLNYNLKAFQMVVKAPFETVANRVLTPLVFSESQQLTIIPKGDYFAVGFDRVFVSYQNIKEIKIKLSLKSVAFLKKRSSSFIKKLKEKFISES